MEKKTILIVDDEINVCKSIDRAIQNDEYEVRRALSGEEAIDKIKENPCDLVIADLMMPGIGGIDLLKFLKTDFPKINVIMITGYPTIKTAVQAIKMGAFDYIAKPFTPEQLRTVVARCFKSEKEPEKRLPLATMPPGIYYIIGHTWVRLEEKNKGLVGVVHDFLKTVGRITNLQLPKVNDNVLQGEMCAKIKDDAGFNYGIWSPATGKVTEVNEELNKDFSLLKQSPYNDGWLFRCALTDFEEDKESLLLSK
ncbi:MAG: response regulator [Candidatus Aminicenantes bacterium]|nr:response regulator [Candidatus Aminicenantes bacterium]HHF51719.1 response regulator [Candidatus Aminicenantes bacterium]